MVNLSLYRHYEALKRANKSVRFSLILITAWAASLILLLKLSKLSYSPVMKEDWDVFAAFSILIFLVLIYAIVAGFRGGDAERKNADFLINSHLILNKNDEASSKHFCEQLNAFTMGLENNVVKANAFNCIAAILIAISYFYFCSGYLDISPDFMKSRYFWVPVIIFAVFFLAAWLWSYMKETPEEIRAKTKAKSEKKQIKEQIKLDKQNARDEARAIKNQKKST